MTIDFSLSPKPPMGFNTWNRFGMGIDERLLEDTMEALVNEGLAAAGYTAVNIDDGWMAPERNSRGRLAPDPIRFSQGIGRLVERAHSADLTLGIYSDCGVKTCGGLVSSYGHEQEDAATFAEWGADYLKYDWCNVPFEAFPGRSHREVAQTLYGRMSEALLATGHPMILSMCNWGEGEPWEWARGIAHLWRTTGDIADVYRGARESWQRDLVSIFHANVRLSSYAGRGGWNDPDMLEVGNGGMTDTEYRTHFALWCLMAAPLLIGTDLRSMSDETQAILTNRALIAIDQDCLGKPCEEVETQDECHILSRSLANGDLAVGVFNEGDEEAHPTLDWERLVPALPGGRVGTDVWSGREERLTGRDTVTLEAHATRVWRIQPTGGRA